MHASATFAKARPTSPRSYPYEVAGLRWLAAAGDPSAAIVDVVEVNAVRLVLARIEPVRPTAPAAEDFGRRLAGTHAAGATAFGAPPDGWTEDGFIGTQPMTLQPADRWGAFYADQRMLPYATEAHRRGTLDDHDLAGVRAVADRLRSGDFDDRTTAARLHGDLWSGNVIFAAAGVVLIDPAAHGGHPLTDLAMLALFGAPHLDRILAAYAEVGDLPSDWRDLIELHQLHPLLVHAVTHGAAYGDEAGRIARRYA